VLIAPLVALKWLGAEPATAYAVLLHAIQMVCLIVLGVWGLSRLDIKMGEVLAEVRSRVGSRGQNSGQRLDS
jgi:cytochrome oxidase assembly protein ShyY1